MGVKGDKLTNQSNETAAFLSERLHALPAFTSKKMFGGHGLFTDGKMFGLVDSKGTAFLKCDEATRATWADSGSVRHSRMPYSSIPPQIMEDENTLMEWADHAVSLCQQ